MSGYQFFIAVLFLTGGTTAYLGRREMSLFHLYAGGTEEWGQVEDGLIFLPGLIRTLGGIVIMGVAGCLL